MKAVRLPLRGALLLPAALLLALLPSAQPAPLPQARPAAAAGSAPVSLLYDPGPAHDCYSMLVEDPPDGDVTPDPARVSSRGCGAFAGTEEFTRNEPTRPTWDLGTYGYGRGQWGRSPGYAFSQTPQNGGASKTVTMTNDATALCRFRETNVSYTYSGAQLRPGPDRRPVTMADGRVDVSYRAKVSQRGGFSCQGGERRALLTTDVILEDSYHGASRPHVISVVHFDPGKFRPVQPDGVMWSTLPKGATECPASGCRVMVRDTEQLTDSTRKAVSVDFSRLFQQYQSHLNPRNLPASAFRLRGVQVVSSNTGSATTTEVSEVDARLTPGAAPRGPLTYGLKGAGGRALCLDDFGNDTTSPAVVSVWECNGGSAQNWTMGRDGTLRVNGLCLDAAGGGTANGTAVQLYTCNGGSHQKWVLGRYDQVYNPASGRCLEVEDASTAPGVARLRLYDCWGGVHQKWRT
ncbi:ricin-type beta-trefoil lectin domain protein [Streptomyces lichenis]|uniref:Ricin-type beta-trefoil lectin domain protein n=1 Tax=Streptomyces lichenis TaxID=2306967 RepID=A0ABT0I7T6_9ACTN|nr:RICIN domain-containing protein [Streptomyces lichenis]MCK8677390.1 ricin-type beta-trefoil lectin domain protein [Streptomyces lichenis]